MPEDKMTASDIAKEYGMSEETAYMILNDPEMPTQAYTRPKFVLRSELLKYFSKRHDNLGE